MKTKVQVVNKMEGAKSKRIARSSFDAASVDVGRTGLVLTRRDAQRFVAACRRHGKTIGFTNGCFDCCHLGHLSSIDQARALCDVLIVGVNTDKWIKAHKGKDRPIQDEVTRSVLLASMANVAAVVLFGEETALPLVKVLKPDVIAKEGYAMKDWPEGRWVQEHGGQAIMLKRVEGYSTTLLCRKQ